MASITIAHPPTDSTVEQTFDADGSFTTTAGLGMALDGTCGQVVCTLYDSSHQQIQQKTYPIAGRTPPPTGNWGVTFTVGQTYTDCSITAELQINGTTPPYPTDTVTGIDIS